MDSIKIDVNSLPEQVEVVGIAMTRQIFLDGEHLPEEESQKICNHSPDGFNWSYIGSGPRQLSLAICNRFLGAEEAQRVYKGFTDFVVANLPEGNFRLVLNFKKWYEHEIEFYGLANPLLLKLHEVMERQPFELEDSGMTVMSSPSFIPTPEGFRRGENPLL